MILQRTKPRRKRPELFYQGGERTRFLDSRSYITKDGRIRLKGDDYEAFRRRLYVRAQGKCECGCGRFAPWESDSIAAKGDAAHNEHGARKSDELIRAKWMRHECHMKSHNCGGKPCPPKPKAEILAYDVRAKGASCVRALELFAGRMSVSRAFVARGWSVTAIDIVAPAEIPEGIDFLKADVLTLDAGFFKFVQEMYGWVFDFGWASSVCDGFASFGMKHFRPNPPHPEMEIKLFNHTRRLFETAGIPHVMENVRTAQQFVGPAVAHCGPFYLWGNAVPPILPQGITKTKWYRRPGKPGNFADELNWPKAERKAKLATIPPELANAVAEYAERLLEVSSLTRG